MGAQVSTLREYVAETTFSLMVLKTFIYLMLQQILLGDNQGSDTRQKIGYQGYLDRQERSCHSH